MESLSYDARTTALLIVDPYNDFLSEGGKLWPFIEGVAKSVGLLDNLRKIVKAVRAADIQMIFVPHRRWQPGDYDHWCHLNLSQEGIMKHRVFAAGEWGGEWHPEFVPKPGDIVVSEHWAQSGSMSAQESIKKALASKPNASIYSYPGQRHALSRHNGAHFNAEAAA